MDANDNAEQVIDQLLSRVDSARAEDTKPSERATVEDVIRQLKDLSKHSPSPALDYALAYAWYFHPDRMGNQTIQERVTTLLSSVVQTRPNDFHAWLYLGHNAFDAKLYDTAFDYFSRACALASKNYLGLKAHEMLVCCMIYKSGIGASLDALEQFVARAEEQPIEDIWPQQLATTLKNCAATLDTAHLIQLNQLLVRLDRVGAWGSWFQNLITLRS